VVHGNGAGRAMRDAGRGRRLAVLAVLPLVLAGCEWFTDFKDQPRIEPWEAEYQGMNVGFRGQPPNSVPMFGGGIPEFEIGLGRFPAVFPAVIDSFAGMTNPIPANERSLDVGRKYYQINCTVCHGAAGAGNGVMLQYGVAAPSLVNERAVSLSDGYYYGMIRNGRGSMPNYARIEHLHRWDVVNYIRALQAGGAVDTAAVGMPGETGDRLPGATLTAPTRPSPHMPPSGPMGGAAATQQQVDSTGAPVTAAPASGSEVRP
jgi:mono/diheme cytochrome c family protein